MRTLGEITHGTHHGDHMNEWDLKHVDVGVGAGFDQRGGAPEHGGGVRIHVKLTFLTKNTSLHSCGHHFGHPSIVYDESKFERPTVQRPRTVEWLGGPWCDGASAMLEFFPMQGLRFEEHPTWTQAHSGGRAILTRQTREIRG